MSSVGERGIFTQMVGVTVFRRMREGRLNEVTKEHPHDITVALGCPVEKGLLMSEGSGGSTFSCRPGRHPMEGGCSKLRDLFEAELRTFAGELRTFARKLRTFGYIARDRKTGRICAESVEEGS